MEGVGPEDGVLVLANKELLGSFLPEVRHAYQIRHLLRNQDSLCRFHTLKEYEEHICDNDKAWLELRQKFGFSDEFVEKNKERISGFLYRDGAGIISAFCRENERCRESARRLVVAELMGKFHELKYHKDDLSKEIDFSVSPEQKLQWMTNESGRDGDGFRIWEEDRLLPVIQIGEIPTYTCLSYRSGGQKDCLLSCFDTNKKVIFASRGTEILFRAILRLTKGIAGVNRGEEETDKPKVEFLDLTAGEDTGKETQAGGERLILFLERAYYRSLSKKELKLVMQKTAEFAQRKAEKMGVPLIISPYYNVLCDGQEAYFASKYSIYISKSKNGRQYLDSLGGSASIADSGSYRYGTFITKAELPAGKGDGTTP